MKSVLMVAKAIFIVLVGPSLLYLMMVWGLVRVAADLFDCFFLGKESNLDAEPEAE